MMSEQLALDLGKRQRKIYERWVEFHALNPHVFEALENLTAKYVARGVTHVGIAHLFEVLRHDLLFQTSRYQGEFKLNNDFRAPYVRLLIEKHPEYSNLFELRHLRST